MLSLSGCSAPTIPSATPSSAIAVQYLSLRWWEDFQDPAINQLVIFALRDNLDLATAVQRVREQRALRRQSTSALFPTVSATGAHELARSASDGMDESYLYALDLSWEIDLFGRLRALNKAAEASLQASGADYESLRVSLIAEVVLTYLRYRLALEQEAIAQQAADNQQQTADITRIRFNSGTASGFDVERFEAQVNITRATVPVAREQASAARHDLAYLLNHDQADIDAILAKPNVPQQPPSPQVAALLQLPASSLRSRPDVRAAELRLKATAAELNAAKALRYPQLTLGALVGLEQGGSQPSWSMTGQLLQPLINFGQIQSTIEVSDARQQQAWLTYQSALMQALREVRNAIVSYNQGLERQRLLGLALQGSANARALARRQYEAGTISLIEVLDAERVFFDAQREHQQAATDVLLRWSEIYRTLGIPGPESFKDGSRESSLTTP
jgi:NodT family efflux transporter outer membrane factor (OMF) lipoprotein